MQKVFKRISLDAGFALLAKSKAKRRIGSTPVTAPVGKSLYQAVRASGQPLKCWNCEATGNCFVMVREPAATNQLFLKLCYQNGDKLVEMTRDHIIPRSLAGCDALANLRVSCFDCNQARGSDMSEDELQFMKDHPELLLSGGRPVPYARAKKSPVPFRQAEVRQAAALLRAPKAPPPVEAVPATPAPDPAVPGARVPTPWDDYNRLTRTWSWC